MRSNNRAKERENIFAPSIDLQEEYTTPRYPKSDAAVQFIDSALEDNFIFASLSPHERRLLIDAMMMETVPAGKVIIKQGEVAGPGSPIVRVVNLNEFELKANVAENHALAVKTGIPVKLYFPDLKKEIEAKINFVGNVIDPLNRTFNVVIRFKNPDIGIKPNMIAVVKIEDFSSESEVVIPLNAIMKQNNERFVYVAKEQDGNFQAKRVNVVTDLDYNGMTVIKEGLSATDKLITFGFQDLVDGQIVKF